jgi:hypothetical protein
MLAQGEAAGSGTVMVLVLVGLAVYLIRTIVAVRRRVPNIGSVAGRAAAVGK